MKEIIGLFALLAVVFGLIIYENAYVADVVNDANEAMNIYETTVNYEDAYAWAKRNGLVEWAP